MKRILGLKKGIHLNRTAHSYPEKNNSNKPWQSKASNFLILKSN